MCDDGLPSLRAPTTAINVKSSKLTPYFRDEVDFDHCGTPCRDIYKELFTSARDMPVYVGKVKVCACSDADGCHPASDAANARGPNAKRVSLRARQAVVLKAVRVISRLDKVGSLMLHNISWRNVHVEGRSALCNPAYFSGLTSLGLFNIDFHSSSQFLQMLEIVPALRVETLTVADCGWKTDNYHPDQVASSRPLKLKSLEINEHHDWAVGSYRALMEWLIGNRSECSIEVVDVVWWSVDFVPLINLLRRVAPGMSKCVLIMVTFDRWDNDRNDSQSLFFVLMTVS